MPWHYSALCWCYVTLVACPVLAVLGASIKEREASTRLRRRNNNIFVLEQAPIYDENLAKIGPASPGEIIIIMIAGRNHNSNFDRAKV